VVFIYKGERFNSISHLIGVIFAVAGASSLITLAAITHDFWKILSTAVYGAVLILLYTSSTLYHSFKGRAKEIFQKIDHIAIYLLIAGSYTPFALVSLRGPWGWWLFGINWTLAVLGITYELTLSHKTRIPSLITYLVMGWLVVVALKPLSETLSPQGMGWLVAGGLFYTGGVGFYVFDSKIKHFHGIWHLFVLGGSICHYICIAAYLI
jgi:hemolysin III